MRPTQDSSGRWSAIEMISDGLRHPIPLSPFNHSLNASPLLVTVAEAQKLLRLGKTKVFALLNEGTLERRKVGGATRITMKSIQRLAGDV